MRAVENGTTRTNNITNFSHPKVYSDVGDKHEGLIEFNTDRSNEKKCWFSYIHFKDSFALLKLELFQ